MARARDTAGQIVEREIEAGRLLPSHRLDAAALARRFPVSRTPAHEALLRPAAMRDRVAAKTRAGRARGPANDHTREEGSVR